MLVAIGSVKGSPGATTLALALAARWPAPGAVVVEADPAGGDLAFRFGQRREPGLSDLAADTRRRSGGRELRAYTQPLELGVEVVFGPADQRTDARLDAPGEAMQAVRMLAGNGIGLLRAAAAARLVVVDVGRLSWESPVWPLVAAADVLLVVCRGGLAALDAVQVRRDRLVAAAGARTPVRLLLVGQTGRTVTEVERAVRLPVAAQVPHDRRAAEVLDGTAPAGWAWTRLPLPRAVRALALALYAETPISLLTSTVSRSGPDPDRPARFTPGAVKAGRP